MGNTTIQTCLKHSNYQTANGLATLVEGSVLFDDYEWKVVAWMYRWDDGRLHLGLPTDSRLRALWQGLHAFRAYNRAGLNWQAGIQVRRKLGKVLENVVNGDAADDRDTPAKEKEIHMATPETKVEGTKKEERTQCTARTWPEGDGPRCPRKATPGQTVCWFHTPEKMAERAAARQKKAEQAAALSAVKPATLPAQEQVPPAAPTPATAPAFTGTPGIANHGKPAKENKAKNVPVDLVQPKSTHSHAVSGAINRSTPRG